MSATPDTAVVIPVGSVDARLGRQIRSVLDQELDVPFEIVLSINSPDPAVRRAVEQLEAEIADPRLRSMDSSSRRGAAHARNAGFASTSAARVAFCDADDFVHPGWLAGLMRGLEVDDAVSGRVIDVFADERMSRWHPPATPGDLPSFLGGRYLLSGNLAVRRDAFEAVGGFDETLTRCEDIALGWALTRAGRRIGYAEDAVLDYHHRAGISSMLKQHYFYGRGMSEVIARYGVPSADGFAPARGLGAMRPNNQKVNKRTIVGTMRRGALAIGRVRGMMVRSRRAQVQTNPSP